ncbi:MAG: 1-acyl-sn-glycerol-3-phosphate acyltransferase [Oryzihumus sp.]
MDDPNVVPLRATPGAEASGAGQARRPRPSGVDALAAGAARASGERAKRRSTPLIGDPADNGAPPVKAHRPRPVAKPRPVAAAEGKARTRAKGEARRTGTRRTAPATAPAPEPQPTEAAPAADRIHVSGVEELVRAAVSILRTAAQAAGLSGEEVERQVAGTLAFLRRRLTGDYTVDDFGFDPDFTEHVYLPLLRPLYRSWFRVEVRGIENIPAEGGALVVANHSGTVALDSLMTQVAVHDEHPAHRHLRMLGADLVFQTPVVGDLARKSGSTLAANADAERLLSSGELAGVWPEGFKGIGKPFSERYKLQRFGRGGFVSAALRTGVPIIPCSIVGAEEIYPIIGNMKAVARLLGAPYAPITPTWPLLGPLGLIPLPSKWIIEFGAPVETDSLGPQAADDPMLVFDLTDQVRETIQQTLYSLLMQRRSVFF